MNTKMVSSNQINENACINNLPQRPVFTGLDNVVFKPVCLASITKEIKKGDLLFSQGDSANYFYIIKEGTIKLVKLTEEGEESVVQVVGPGDILGESTLFSTISFHPITAIALENTKFCYLSRSILEELVKKNPDLAWELLLNLSNQLNRTWEKILELNTLTTLEKITVLFKQMSSNYGERCDQGTLIKIKLTQQDIASIVGASRVMVSNALQKLIKSQRLIKEKKYYIIKDN